MEPTLQPAPDLVGAYAALRDRGARAVEAGRLVEALELFDAALSEARRLGDEKLVDRAFCNHSLVTIELGGGDEAVPELRQILVRNRDLENCRLAAYHIAEVYQLRKQYKKAKFYAQIALDRSLALERDDWVASSRNRLGNILLAESFVDDACRQYELALAAGDELSAVWRASIHQNLGYARVLQRRFREGLGLLYRGLRTLRRCRAERFQALAHLDLSFAHLEIERYGDALRHGLRALALAERHQLSDSIKNALYLVGEAAELGGDRRRAVASFSRLERYYPDAPFLTDFLLSVDVRKMINLRA